MSTGVALTKEQDEELGRVINRCMNGSKLLNYAETPQGYVDRFFLELNDDIASLKRIFPDGGKEYEDQLLGLTTMWDMNFRSCPAKLLDSVLMGQTLRTLFADGGVFEKVIPLMTIRSGADKGKLVAAMYHMAMNQPEKFEPWLKGLSYPIALIVMGQGDGPAAFVEELKMLQKSFGGETHIEALPEITKRKLEELVENPQTLQRCGGAPALARAGVDIWELLNKLQENIRLNSHAPSLFHCSFEMIIEATGHLHGIGFLEDEARDYQLSKLAYTCFDEIDRTHHEKFFNKEFWRNALAQVTPFTKSDVYTTTQRLVTLLKYSDPDPQWLDRANILQDFKPEHVKAALKEAFSADKLYDAVTRLRALDLYDENERIEILGEQFSNDLGL